MLFASSKFNCLYFRRVLIKDGNLLGCYFNTTDVLGQFHFSDSQQIAIIRIKCENQLRVYMTPYEGRKHANIMSVVRIRGCQTNVFDWNNVGIATTMIILSIFENIYERNFQNYSVNSCPALESINVFRYFNIENESLNVIKHLSCLHFSPKMASIRFENMSLTKFSNEFRTIFPNLQSLNLNRNKLTVPPTTFPWNKEEQNLVNNVSIAQYIVNSRSKSKLDIPAHIFSRDFILGYNSIKNLTEYTFHGYLHKISLNKNGMKVIGAKVFQATSGLQIINLKSNKLEFLPNKIFENLTNLRYLDISKNRLAILQSNVFADLFNLQSLILGNNSLKILPEQLFTNLHQLKILNIQHNFISKLDAKTFPVGSNALTYVFFNNNPIKNFLQSFFG